MAKQTLVQIVGTDKIDTSTTGYRKLISFYFGCKAYSDCDVTLDFTEIEWIDANMCALFTAILHKLNKENNLTFLIDKANYSYIKTTLNFLFMNGFLQDVVKIPSAKSAIVLTTFNKDEDEKFLNYIENDLMGNIGMKITDKDKKEMIDNFLEIFSNVQIHAQTEEPIFACGQFFKMQGKLNFSLVDLGIGYLPPIEKFTKGKISNSEAAIEWAVKGNSTKPDAPGGTGLKRIVNYCNENKSTLSIVTGNTYWVSDAQITYEIPPFCGTIINLSFNCK